MPDESAIATTAELLVPLLYDDMRRIAHRIRWQASSGATMQTTALVHEAYLKLRRSDGFNDRQHFLASAAIAMRQILVNLAHEALAQKRGGGAVESMGDDLPEMPAEDAGRLIEVTNALDRLTAFNPRLARVVECRFFGGYSEEETATALGVSDRTVRRDWLKARAWLLKEMGAR